jgi:hypothetical protein
MSFFKPTAPQAPVPQHPARPNLGGERGLRGAVPDRMAQERARIEAMKAAEAEKRAAMERNDQIEVAGQVLNPRGRPIGVQNTATANNRLGLAGNVPLDRSPRGCLFRIGPGFFDLDGFWCVANHLNEVTVTRGCSKEQMSRLSKDQRRILEQARLKARRNGVR